MTENAGGAATVVARFEPTDAEHGEYWRILGRRQSLAAGEDLGWYSYLGAIPIGLIGFLTALGLGVDGSYGARVGMLIGLAYIIGQYVMSLFGRLRAARLRAAYRQGDLLISITVTEGGVATQWRKSSAFWSFKDITQLTRERELLIFWIGPWNGIYLPLRALAAGEEAQILRIARGRISAKPVGK